MRFLALAFIFLISGCASLQMSEYISRVDHPYDRKFYASLEKVTSSFIYVLKNKGWSITSEADPSVYERDDRYDNTSYQNLLLATNIRKKYSILYSTYSHLNIFIHAIGNTCDVEIRFESKTPFIRQFSSGRNDGLIQGIFDAVEQEVDR